jgi:tetratricopeptide (TPR) repeat protein
MAIQLNRRDPEAYLRRGRLFAAQEKWDAAISDFDFCIHLDSTNVLAYYSRALTRYEKKDYTGTMSDFDKVIALEPNNALTYYNRALIRTQIGDLDLALKDYERVIEINPNNILVYFNRAGLWMEKNKPREAIVDYSNAIDLYPDFASAYINRSMAKRQIKDLKGAEKDYKIAQEKIKVHKNKLQDSTSGFFADTSQQFNQLIALDADFGSKIFNNDISPSNAIELQNMARLVIGVPENSRPLTAQYIYAPYEQYRQSIAPLQASIRFDYSLLQDSTQLDSLANEYIAHNTRSGMGYYLKALQLHKQGQYTAALEYYRQALKIEPGNVYFRMNTAVSKSEMIDFISNVDNNFQNVVLDESSSISNRVQHQKNTAQYSYEEPLQEITQAIRIEPNFAPLYYNKGIIECNAGQMIEGIADFSKAIDLDPKMAEAYYNRGLVQIYLKDTEKGCLDISKAGELGMRSAYTIVKQYCKKKL